jgi:hypothetical protein
MDISLPWIDAAYLTLQALPKYIYLSPPLIFPTTYNGIRTKNRPVWITGQEIVYLWVNRIAFAFFPDFVIGFCNSFESCIFFFSFDHDTHKYDNVTLSLPPLIFPTTYNGIRTKNRPVWITPGAAPIRWMGPIRNPRWEQKQTEGYVIVFMCIMRGWKKNIFR